MKLESADRDRFESWVATDAARRLTVAALRHPQDGGMLSRDDADIEDWWAQCREQMRTPGGQLVAGAVHSAEAGRELCIGMPMAVASRWWQAPAPWVALAASILCAWLSVRARRSTHARPGSQVAVAEHAYTTARGERAVVTLDGATVVLGPESVLRISGSYGVRASHGLSHGARVLRCRARRCAPIPGVGEWHSDADIGTLIRSSRVSGRTGHAPSRG